MTKEALIEAIAKEVNIPKTLAQRAVDALARQLTDALRAGQLVALPPLGRFAPVTRPARMVRNPTTGEAVQIQERHTVRFKPARALLQALAPGGSGTPQEPEEEAR